MRIMNSLQLEWCLNNFFFSQKNYKRKEIIIRSFYLLILVHCNYNNRTRCNLYVCFDMKYS